MMPPFAAQQSLFRAYDIRGARQYFTNDFIQALAQAFAQLYTAQKTSDTARTVVIGYDVRCGSNAIAQTLADILRQHGLFVIDLGLVTTPITAFWAQQYDGHGIMVTASHSAKDNLGVKWLVDNVSPSDSEIQALYKSLSSNNLPLNRAMEPSNSQSHCNNKANNAQNTAIDLAPINPAFYNIAADANSNISPNIILSNEAIIDTYIQAIAEVFSRIQQQKDMVLDNRLFPAATESKLDITVVIDCMSGATSRIAQPLFACFCKRVIMLNDTPDGDFPTGNPDPTEPNRLAELQQTVIVNTADIGLAFDGDGDRLMIVDNRGKVVTPDHLLYLLAQVAMTERPNPHNDPTAPHVLFDIKCSHHLPKLLSALGANPVMTRTGSSLLRRQLQLSERYNIFAGELSGHFIFNDSYFIVYDDAMYAGLRLLHWLMNTAPSLNVVATLDFSNDTNIMASSDADTPLDSVPMTTDLWGELRSGLPPYKLTDITQSLPTFVSTADHYLPLMETSNNECSAVKHLADFCRHLQRLADNTVTLKTAALCDCFSDDWLISAQKAQQLLPQGTQLSCIDGVRLDFAHGFGVLRQSNTSHSLTVRFAGDSVADLKDIQAHFVVLCQSFDKNLAAQIANIYPE